MIGPLWLALQKMEMRPSLFLFIFPLVVLAGCGSNNAAVKTGMGSTGKITSVRWIDSAKNFGNINEGQKLAISFKFKNTGVNPLIIESVKPGCGCTVADFPKEPIAPGAENEITGEFDSHDREGLQHKVITVKSNTPGNGEQEVYFDVDVVKKPGSADNN
jgi:hypothetical protein